MDKYEKIPLLLLTCRNGRPRSNVDKKRHSEQLGERATNQLFRLHCCLNVVVVGDERFAATRIMIPPKRSKGEIAIRGSAHRKSQTRLCRAMVRIVFHCKFHSHLPLGIRVPAPLIKNDNQGLAKQK